ncbi:hypothetical protein [Zhengella mangrovi]|uniref:hypothetical protein n=1 Tax=Zhengella mangrovi TaxID=1982044 RepID=UPI0013FE3873|nr:hypothetical protein [Zhengella mangrovi]
MAPPANAVHPIPARLEKEIARRNGRAIGFRGSEHFRDPLNRINAPRRCFRAIPDAKPVPTFAGIALAFPQFRTRNRYPLSLELLLPADQ